MSSLNLLFSRLNSSSSFSLSLSVRGPNLLIMSMVLCWTHSSMSMSLLYWRAQSGIQHPRSVTPVLSRQEGSPPLPCCQQSSPCSSGGCWPSFPQWLNTTGATHQSPWAHQVSFLSTLLPRDTPILPPDCYDIIGDRSKLKLLAEVDMNNIHCFPHTHEGSHVITEVFWVG